jgi:hypothetical protein
MIYTVCSLFLNSKYTLANNFEILTGTVLMRWNQFICVTVFVYLRICSIISHTPTHNIQYIPRRGL